MGARGKPDTGRAGETGAGDATTAATERIGEIGPVLILGPVPIPTRVAPVRLMMPSQFTATKGRTMDNGKQARVAERWENGVRWFYLIDVGTGAQLDRSTNRSWILFQRDRWEGRI